MTLGKIFINDQSIPRVFLFLIQGLRFFFLILVLGFRLVVFRVVDLLRIFAGLSLVCRFDIVGGRFGLGCLGWLGIRIDFGRKSYSQVGKW